MLHDSHKFKPKQVQYPAERLYLLTMIFKRHLSGAADYDQWYVEFYALHLTLCLRQDFCS